MSDPAVCECCGQPMPKPERKALLITHKLETPGHPDSYYLRSGDAVVVAEARMAGGARSHCYAYDRQTATWGYWRSWG